MPEYTFGGDINDLKSILKLRLSVKRYTHSLNVASAAKRLAEKYGEDEGKAYLAGLLHDICKEIPKSEQLEMASKCGRSFTDTEKGIPPLYHAPAGAWYCENILHIQDEDILNAVRFHTTGRACMSPLERTVYLADLISDDRSYKDVNRMRRLAFSDPARAMLEAVRFAVSDIVSKGSLIPESTCGAYNYYTGLYRQRKAE